MAAELIECDMEFFDLDRWEVQRMGELWGLDEPVSLNQEEREKLEQEQLMFEQESEKKWRAFLQKHRKRLERTSELTKQVVSVVPELQKAQEQLREEIEQQLEELERKPQEFRQKYRQVAQQSAEKFTKYLRKQQE